jgi:PhoH-like ATPase
MKTVKRRGKKTFVLDTNVILHDSDCIRQFGPHDVVVPVPVLEELDNFKKGNDSIHFHAREFVRTLDSLSGDKLFDGGVPIGRGHGRIAVKLGRPFHKHLRLSFPAQNPDHHILNIAYWLSRSGKSRQTILVTKDVNLRMKAKAVGLVAQDYTMDHVKDIGALYTGSRVRENAPLPAVKQMYRVPFEANPSALHFKQALLPNEFVILRNPKKSALAVFDAENKVLKRVDKAPAYGINPRNAEQAFALNALMNRDIPLVTLTGKAGTGKTLLALAAALEKRKQYRQIFLARPVVPLSNKDLGFLPGDLDSKLEPYMQPLFDNLGVIQHQFAEAATQNRRIRELLKEEKLVVAPLSYIRGRSLVKVYFIVDEAQNLTPHEVKTVITRAGEGSKVVFTGDIFQIDHPYLNSHSNGLSSLIEKMRGQKVYAHINLEKGERSALSELASHLL